MALPLVSGLTETADETRPALPRLIEVLSRRPTHDSLAMAIGHLEHAFKSSDDRLRGRITLAIELLRGEKNED